VTNTIDFLNLSWTVQVALASGYLAYAIAYAGLKNRHSTLDTAFITLAFSLVATTILYVLSLAGQIISSGAAVSASLAAGVAWRKWGRDTYRWAAREFDLSWANDDASALDSLTGNTTNYLTQIAVQLDDGTWLRCDDTMKFSDAPHGPALIGPNGDIALYLTHEDAADGTSKEMKFTRDAYYGDLVTYVPASRIKLITLRHKPISAWQAERAAEQVAAEAAPSVSPSPENQVSEVGSAEALVCEA
jgi:hypothetical protein